MEGIGSFELVLYRYSDDGKTVDELPCETWTEAERVTDLGEHDFWRFRAPVATLLSGVQRGVSSLANAKVTYLHGLLQIEAKTIQIVQDALNATLK